MSTDSLNAYKVVVLKVNVQNYTSSEVSGGGGTVTSVGGVVRGNIDDVVTTVRQHSKQDIWVKDLATNEEKNIILNNTVLPVREGHMLYIIYDKKSKCWERLINETTKESSFGNGTYNPAYAKEFIGLGNNSMYWAIGLAIPFINMLVGIAALLTIFKVPISINGEKIDSVASRMLITICSGGILFGLSFYILIFMIKPSEHSFFIQLIVVSLYLAGFVYFKKSFQDLYHAPGEMIKTRSNLLDQMVSSRST